MPAERVAASPVLPTHQERESATLVTSENLLMHLLPLGTDHPPASSFPSTFNLELLTPEFTTALENLENKMTGQHTPPKGDTLLQEGVDTPVSGNTARQHSRNITKQEEIPNGEGEQTILERGFTFYFDSQKTDVFASEIIDGKPNENEVELDVYKLIGEGKYPLIPVHWDPAGLFSDWDYTVFLQKGAYRESEDIRPVRASIAVSPDIQVLAVVTEDTPSPMSAEELDEFIVYWGKRFKEEDQETLTALSDRRDELSATGKEVWEERLEERIGRLYQQAERLQKGLLPEEEVEEVYQEQAAINALDKEGFDPNTMTEYDALTSELAMRSRQANNRVHLELAHAMGVKLYTSTNKKDFKEFTA